MPVFLLDWRYMNASETESVLKTLAFFDVVGMPVRLTDVRRWQWGSEVISKTDMLTILDWHATLGPRATLRDEQSSSLVIGVMPWLRRLCYWPGVQALYLCNSVAFLSANEQSDIDIFIVCKPGQVWSTRFVLTALLAMFGKRPKPGKEAGTICLSFFTDARALDLSVVALPAPKDVYLSYWAATLAPVYDPTDTELRLLDSNRALFPNERTNTLRRLPSATVFGAQALPFRLLFTPAYWLTKLLQPLLKRWQYRRFPAAIIEASKAADHGVVISDAMLKFHTNDRREAYRLAWNKRYDLLKKAWESRTA